MRHVFVYAQLEKMEHYPKVKIVDRNTQAFPGSGILNVCEYKTLLLMESHLTDSNTFVYSRTV